jgi:glycopeptide antibiotics resistance protein
MGVYVDDIRSAVYAFPLIAFVLTLPFMWWHYHKYHGISRWRVFWIYIFVFYLLCAYFLIILPLPERSVVAKLTTPKYNLVPLTFVREFIKYNPLQLSHPHTWKAALLAPSMIQPAFNVALTIPFGAMLRYYFHRPWWQVITGTFCLSLFFELTQLSGLYGYYPRPYRLFDVDDLLLNTSGGWIGCGIARIVMPILPTDEQMDRSAAKRVDNVSMWRRLAGFVIDWLVVAIVTTILGIVGGLVTSFHFLGDSWFFYLFFLFWMALPPTFGQPTLGMRVVRLTMTTMQGQPVHWWQPVLRILVGYGTPLATIFGLTVSVDAINGIGFSRFTWGGVGMIASLLLLSIMLGDWLWALVFHNHTMIFESITRTKMANKE